MVTMTWICGGLFQLVALVLQLDLTSPRRDEEKLPQRLGAEGALSKNQLPPDYGGTHHSSQCDAKVRS